MINFKTCLVSQNSQQTKMNILNLKESATNITSNGDRMNVSHPQGQEHKDGHSHPSYPTLC